MKISTQQNSAWTSGSANSAWYSILKSFFDRLKMRIRSDWIHPFFYKFVGKKALKSPWKASIWYRNRLILWHSQKMVKGVSKVVSWVSLLSHCWLAPPFRFFYTFLAFLQMPLLKQGIAIFQNCLLNQDIRLKRHSYTSSISNGKLGHEDF